MTDLNKYLKDRLLTIESIIVKPRKSYRSETFHLLRVEIKKFKALLEVIEFANKSFNRKTVFKSYREVFKAAGLVRDFYVEADLLKGYIKEEVIPHYFQHIHHSIRKNREDYFKVLHKYSLNDFKSTYKIVAPYLKKVDAQRMDKYLKAKRNEIKSHLEKHQLSTEQIHDLRKLIKTYTYNLKLASSPKRKLISEKVDLPQLLGEWHDCFFIISNINEVLKRESFSAKERKTLVALKAKVAQKKRKYLLQLKKSIPDSGWLKL